MEPKLYISLSGITIVLCLCVCLCVRVLWQLTATISQLHEEGRAEFGHNLQDSPKRMNVPDLFDRIIHPSDLHILNTTGSDPPPLLLNTKTNSTKIISQWIGYDAIWGCLSSLLQAETMTLLQRRSSATSLSTLSSFRGKEGLWSSNILVDSLIPE